MPLESLLKPGLPTKDSRKPTTKGSTPKQSSRRDQSWARPSAQVARESKGINIKPKRQLLVGMKNVELSSFSMLVLKPLSRRMSRPGRGHLDVYVPSRLTPTWKENLNSVQSDSFGNPNRMERYFQGETSPNKTNRTTV